jgi:iron complex outermembrane recepter protein
MASVRFRVELIHARDGSMNTQTLSAMFAWLTLAAPALADTPSALDEIEVTAQRRNETAQSVGAALSVLPGSDLAHKHIDNVNDLQNATPSFEAEPAFGSGQAQFRLRGVGFIDYTSNNSSPVSIDIDDVPLALPIQAQGQFFDIDRIEILRGPQGALYGRNTTGGVINVIGNRPSTGPEAGFSVDYGSDNAFSGEGFVSGTLAAGWRGRLALATQQGGAWQRNRTTGRSLGNKNKLAMRDQLEWDATQHLNLRLGLHVSKDRSDALGLDLFTALDRGARGASISADTSRYTTGWGLRPQFAQLAGISTGAKPGVDDENHGADVTARAALGTAELTAITAFDHLSRREYNDWDATQFAESDVFFRSELRSFSQELRLTSTQAGRNAWLAGAYFSDERLAERFLTDFTQSLGGIAATSYRQNGRTLSIFAQGEHAFSDAIKAVVGIRREHEGRELLDLNTSFGSIASISGGNQSRSLQSSDWSGKAALEYHLVPQTLLYASVSRGVKSGGFTAHHTTEAAAVDAFKPERLTALEIGAKVEFTTQLRIDTAAFYYDYRDQQILSKVLDANGALIGRFVNAPRSEIAGAEIELQWQPAARIEISQYVGYKRGKYTAAIFNAPASGGAPVDFDGKDLSFPKLSYGGGLAYRWPWREFKLTTSADFSYHDTYSQLFLLESPLYTIKSYWLGNAGVEITPAQSHSWTLGLWVHNLFNQRYDETRNFFLTFPSAVSRDNPLGGTNVAAPGAPFALGIHFSDSF